MKNSDESNYVGLKNYVDKKYVSNTEFIDEEALNEGSGEMKVADFYYFYTKWCPHCKTATPIVNELKTQIQDNNNLSYDF